MAYTIADRAQAKNMYCLEGKRVEDIAKLIAVPKQTVYRWKALDAWDSVLKQTGSIGISAEAHKGFIEEVQRAIEAKKLTDPDTVNNLVKLSKLMEKLLPKKVMLANIFAMLEDITHYLQTIGDDKLVALWAKHLTEIADFLRKKYSE